VDDELCMEKRDDCDDEGVRIGLEKINGDDCDLEGSACEFWYLNAWKSKAGGRKKLLAGLVTRHETGTSCDAGELGVDPELALSYSASRQASPQ